MLSPKYSHFRAIRRLQTPPKFDSSHSTSNLLPTKNPQFSTDLHSDNPPNFTLITATMFRSTAVIRGQLKIPFERLISASVRHCTHTYTHTQRKARPNRIAQDRSSPINKANDGRLFLNGGVTGSCRKSGGRGRWVNCGGCGRCWGCAESGC